MARSPVTCWSASASGNWSVRPRRVAGPAAAGQGGALGRAMATTTTVDQAGSAPIPARRLRLLAAVRAWMAAGQLGPPHDTTTIGRHTGARC
jgi:hypothetical protein